MRHRNLGLFVVLALFWGSAFVAIKAGLEFFPPVLFAAVRYDLAAVVMVGYVFYTTERPLPRTRREWAAVAAGALLLIAAYHAFLFVGEEHTTSATAAVIVSLSPVLTTAFARALLPDQRLSLVGIAGMVLGLVGVVVLARPNPANLLGGTALAEGLVLAAAASFGLGSVLTQRFDAGLPAETLEAWSMVGGALLLHLASIGAGESIAAVTWTPEALAALAYLSVGASALGFLVYFSLLDRLGPVEINLVSYVAPVVAAIVGFLLLGEVIDEFTVAGFVCILAGFGLIKRRQIVAEWPRLRATLKRE